MEKTRGVNNVYQTSIDYWWYDTNGTMLRSAYVSALIALIFSAVIVMLHSRSLVISLFSLATISYVLFSTTAMLIAEGWTLGFLESVCFAILIGLSCDFVIHLGHAYVHASHSYTTTKPMTTGTDTAGKTSQNGNYTAALRDEDDIPNDMASSSDDEPV